MKWFKHYSDCKNSEHLMALEAKHGLEGYARYWKLLEFLSEKFDGEDVNFKVPTRLLRECMRFKSTMKLRQFADETLIQLGCNLVENGMVYEIHAPILLRLQAEDFKYDRCKRGQNDAKIKDIRLKNKDKRIKNNTQVKTSARPFTHPTNLQEFKDLFPEETWNSWLALYPDMDWIERSLHEAFVYFYVNKTKPPSTTVKDWKARMTNWLKRGWKDYSTQSKPRSGYKSKSRQVTENCKKLWNEIDEDELNEQEQI